MFSLLKYEIKKLCASKLLPIMLIVLTILNVRLILGDIDEKKLTQEQQLDEFLELYVEDPEKWDAYMADFLNAIKLSNDSVRIKDGVVERTVPYPDSLVTKDDYTLFKTTFPAIRDFGETYRKMVDKAERVANGHLSEYAYLGYDDGGFEPTYQRGVIQSYSKLRDIEFPFLNIRGYDIYFNYSGFGVIAMIAMLVGGMLILIPEKSGGMVSILRVSKRGRWETYGAKIMTAFLYCVVVCLILSASGFVAVALKSGLNGWNAPLQMIDSPSGSYRLCPFLLTVGEGIFITFLLRLFSCFVFMLMVIALSAVFTSYIPALLIGIVFTAANYLVATYQFLNDYAPLKNLNFFWSINGKEPIVYWRGIRIFGFCVPMLESLILTYVVLFGAGIFLAGYLYVNGKGMEFRRLRLFLRKCGAALAALPEKLHLRIFTRRARRRATHLHYEIKKIVTPFALIVLVALFTATFILSSRIFKQEENFYDVTYDAYMEEYGGEWTEEKDASLNALFTEYSATVQGYDTMVAKYYAGEISMEEIAAYSNKYQYAKNRVEIVASLCDTSARLRELHNEGKMAYFVNETGWKMISYVNFSYLYLVVIVLLFGNVYAIEYREGFHLIQHSTRGGRGRTNFRKIAIVIVIAVLLLTVCEACQYLMVIRRVGLQYPEAPARSLPLLNDTGDRSIAAHFVLIYLRQLGIVTGLSLLAVLLSRVTKKLLPTIAIIAVIAFAPTIFNYFGIHLFDAFSLITLLGRA